ncbi:2TM domain-containing protein [Piscinibacter sp. XHJ-5]|uniref:2TM domain-containing protein n=1 Tax=Piscinibacter sp. XHJ-5 TaxID=3037797 RepID=UPI0024531BDF|nr:2TM domain-containing protein [Piscinibacter sp. XHJ-5]
MDNDRNDADLEARARRRVGIRTGFYIHALVFVLVNLGLFAINSITGGYRWSVWPLWGWGLGLGVHGIVTFISLQGDGLRERMLRKEMERLRKRP